LLSLADISHSTELLNAVKEFSLGQSGRDELRLAAANQAAYAGLLPIGMHRLWLDGQWTETLLIGIDLVPSIERHHAPKVEKWLRAALGSAKDGQYKQAEALLRQALEVEPDAPDLLFNLAAACQNQRRFEESEALLEQVVAQSPAYVFACANLAQLCISRNQLERAQRLLASLYQIKQMSRSEFDAFCAAHIDLYLAEKDKKAAQAWFGVWESADPQNPRLERYKYLS
jgi:tetratricopeptide (TPR) repeat protein